MPFWRMDCLLVLFCADLGNVVLWYESTGRELSTLLLRPFVATIFLRSFRPYLAVRATSASNSCVRNALQNFQSRSRLAYG